MLPCANVLRSPHDGKNHHCNDHGELFCCGYCWGGKQRPEESSTACEHEHKRNEVHSRNLTYLCLCWG